MPIRRALDNMTFAPCTVVRRGPFLLFESTKPPLKPLGIVNGDFLVDPPAFCLREVRDAEAIVAAISLRGAAFQTGEAHITIRVAVAARTDHRMVAMRFGAGAVRLGATAAGYYTGGQS